MTDNERPAPSARSTETRLLLLAGLFIFINFLALALVNGSQASGHWTHFLVWTLCAFLGHRWLDRTLPGRDPLLFPLTLFLTGWGLVLIDRLSTGFADRQTLWLILGLVVMLAIATVPRILNTAAPLSLHSAAGRAGIAGQHDYPRQQSLRRAGCAPVVAKDQPCHLSTDLLSALGTAQGRPDRLSRQLSGRAVPGPAQPSAQ